jgi:transcription-repair coupling factor (superfamily II helicase)
MRAFGVNVDMISRFRTPKEQAVTLRRLKRGEVDVIIGTHRLISKDIEFHDLGLLIVDEEQRFGVAQKEKLKQLSGNVDVLTLSATPIPRTLNMAMGGLRDISVLDEAPGDRLPVQTYVLEDDDLIVLEAIRRELRRGGQVFYLHNIVETIDDLAAKLGKELPEARITVAHGKMDKDTLERIWEDMLTGAIDILVCTTIIETGVDVPNANTLIVDNAHRLGLSQLHQLRGRVGRSSRRAYAYFTYPKFRALSEISQKRLEAIRDYAEFGAGFKIALRDMEIRGAGNLLGAQQHGHLDAVGYDLYIKLLNRAVLEERGTPETIAPECTISVTMDAYIPDHYVQFTSQRMEMYKKIALIADEQDRDDILDEFLDRYGDLPRATENLLGIALVRADAIRCGVKQLRQEGGEMQIYPVKIDFDVWSAISAAFPGRVRMALAGEPHLNVKMKKGEDILDFLHQMFAKYTESVQENNADPS